MLLGIALVATFVALSYRQYPGPRPLPFGAAAALALLLVTAWLLWRQLQRNDRIHAELERSLGLQDAILDVAGYMIIAADTPARPRCSTARPKGRSATRRRR